MNTASPDTVALAPNDFPWKMGPSWQVNKTQWTGERHALMVKVARSRETGVPLGRTSWCWRGDDVVCTVANARAWTTLPSLEALRPHCLRRSEYMMAESGIVDTLINRDRLRA